MVLRPANKSATVGKSDTESTVLMVILLAILTATATLVLYYLVAGLQENNTVITENVVIDETDESAYVSPEITEIEPEKICLLLMGLDYRLHMIIDHLILMSLKNV